MAALKNDTNELESFNNKENHEPESPMSNKVGFAGFILSSISFVVGWIIGWPPILGALVWFSGLLFSSFGLFKNPKKYARLGFIISIIAGILFLLYIKWVEYAMKGAN